MSVINNVLKDLENKPSAFTPLELADVADSRVHHRLPYRNWYIAFTLLVVAMLAAYYVYQPKAVVPDQQSQVIEAVDLTPETEISDNTDLQIFPSPVEEEPVRTEAELTGLQLNETQNFLELTLQLPIGAQSFLRHSSHNRYIFLISNAGKKIITPDINDNAWLDSITIDETEAGLEIQFYTRDNILVETHHKEKKQLYYWIIRLKKPIPPEIIETHKMQSETVQQAVKADSNQRLTVAPSGPITDNEKIEADNIQQQKVKLEIKPLKSGVSDAELLINAHKAMQQRNWEKAEKQLKQLLNSSVDKKARVKLLALYQLQQQTYPMKLLLSKSLKLYPEEKDLLTVDAGLLFSEKEYLTLIKRYKNKLENLIIINLVAASFQNINQHDSAIEYYQRSLKINPQQSRKWISLAISQEQESQFERALQSYQMALQSGSLNKRLQSFIHKRLQQLSNNLH